jgi:hypothetical protein
MNYTDKRIPLLFETINTVYCLPENHFYIQTNATQHLIAGRIKIIFKINVIALHHHNKKDEFKKYLTLNSRYTNIITVINSYLAHDTYHPRTKKNCDLLL